jgi:hypothetical protein
MNISIAVLVTRPDQTNTLSTFPDPLQFACVASTAKPAVGRLSSSTILSKAALTAVTSRHGASSSRRESIETRTMMRRRDPRFEASTFRRHRRATRIEALEPHIRGSRDPMPERTTPPMAAI